MKFVIRVDFHDPMRYREINDVVDDMEQSGAFRGEYSIEVEFRIDVSGASYLQFSTDDAVDAFLFKSSIYGAYNYSEDD